MNLTPITFKILKEVAKDLPDNVVRKKLEFFFVTQEIPQTIDQTSGDNSSLATTIASILSSPQEQDNEGVEMREETQIKDDEKQIKKDFRIRAMSLRNFRGIGVGKDNIPFGLNFCNKIENEPVSCILLGANGVGKSSFYNGIEICFRGTTAACKKRHEEEDNFYGNIRSSDNNWNIRIITEDKIFEKDRISGKKKQVFDTIDRTAEPFFISESSLAVYEVTGTMESEYIESQLGFTQLSKIVNIINSAKSILENNLQKKMEDLRKGMEDNDKLKTDLKINDQQTNRSSEEEAKLTIKQKKLEIESIKYTVDKMDKNFQAIEQYYNALENHKKTKLNDILIKTKDITSELLKVFFAEYEKMGKDKQDQMEGSSNNKEKKMNALEDTLDAFYQGLLFVDDRQVKYRVYLNNFRYKMYLVCLNIAIAFETMRSTGINFPLVFDDVFDSSDFPNRMSTEDFFRKIFESHDKIEGIKDKPLQVIFFTQDEVIAESIYRGIISNKNNHAILGRLFRSEEYNENDIICEGNDRYINMYDIIKPNEYICNS